MSIAHDSSEMVLFRSAPNSTRTLVGGDRHAQRVTHDLVGGGAVAEVLVAGDAGDGHGARREIEPVLLVAVGDQLCAVDPDLELLVVPRVDLREVETHDDVILMTGEREPLPDDRPARRMAGEPAEHRREVQVLPVGQRTTGTGEVIGPPVRRGLEVVVAPRPG